MQSLPSRWNGGARRRVNGWEAVVNRRIVRTLPLLTVLLVAACSSHANNPSFLPQSPAVLQTGDGDVPFAAANPVRQLCPAAETHEVMECFASVRTDVTPTLTTTNAIGELQTALKIK